MAAPERMYGPRTEETYSKGVQARIKGVFDRPTFHIAKGPHDGQRLHSRHMLPVIPPNPLSSESTHEQVGEFNVAVPDAMARFALADPQVSQLAYMEGIGGFDMHVLPKLAVEAAEQKVSKEDEGEKRNVIRVVYGATEEMPYRGPSYTVPALMYMEHLQQGGIDVPQLQVVMAHNISSTLNRMDQEKVQEEVKRLAHVAKEFAKEAFPSVADHVVFLEDTPLTHGSVLREELLQVAKEVQNNVPLDVQEELFKKGNHGKPSMKLFYGAAHVLLHDADIEGSVVPLFSDQQAIATPKAIISIGGSQERFFYKLRHLVKPYLDKKYHDIDTMQLFTRHLTPPYLMARDDATKTLTADIPLSVVMNDPSLRFYTSGISKTARHNISYLEDMAKARGVVLEDVLQKASQAYYDEKYGGLAA